MESNRTFYEHGRQSDRTYTPTAGECCQGKSAETLKACGDGPDYCIACASCGNPVCDEHRVKLFGLAEYCFGCAKVELDAADLAEAEEIEEKRRAA